MASTAYLTNGVGAVLESDMPFEDNEDLIDISELNNKTVQTQVYDTMDFYPDGLFVLLCFVRPMRHFNP